MTFMVDMVNLKWGCVPVYGEKVGKLIEGAGIYMSIIEIVGGFILGYITSWHFHRKDRKNTKIIQSWMDANYRLNEDLNRTSYRRGRIKKNPDGTYAIAWEIELSE